MNIKSLFHHLAPHHESERPVQDFLQEKFVSLNIVISVILQIMVWYLFFSAKPVPLDTEIILSHNIYFGITWLGPWRRLVMIPLLGLIMFIVNSVLAHFLFSKNKLAAYYLLFGMSLVQVFLVFTMLVKILVNI